jgi:DNA-binding MarR family transcriptional regulator
MAPRTKADPDAATEAWTLFMGLLFSERPPRIPAVAAEFELSPIGIKLLQILEPDSALPMSQLAERCYCDASNVTGIVDRLEERGLVERGDSPADRRVKLIALTAAGGQVREAVIERINEPPAAIAALPKPEQEVLRDLLRRAVGSG